MTLGTSLGVRLPALIYAGQAGAGEGSATLGSRIGGNHIGGNLKSSTFRRTLAALLRGPLALRLPLPNKLDAGSKARLNGWMWEHLSVALVAYPDRQTLAEVERLVLEALDPPLNLQHMERTALRARLSALRSSLGTPTTAPAEAHSLDAPKRCKAPVSQQSLVDGRPDNTLHGAMLIVLNGAGWLSLDETAARVAELGLYWKRNGEAATAGQIRARATAADGRYTELFEVSDSQIRLR